MEKISVKADKRPEIGKGSARSLRRTGMVPAVVYSEGNCIPIKVQTKQMTKLIYSGVGEHALITIELNEDGKKTSDHPVLLKDYQRDPVSEELLHVDFMEVSLKKPVRVMVSVVIVKQPLGVKMGGIMQQHLREVEVECLPMQIPDKFEVDAELIEIGHSLHVSDLPAKEGIKILTDPHDSILSVTMPAAEAPAAEAAATAAEPELVKGKGKADAAKEVKKEG